jgi:hypothetical protein
MPTRKQRTSEPQENPVRTTPRPAGQRPRRIDTRRQTKSVVLAKGLRFVETEASLEVRYGAWRWTTRLLLAVFATGVLFGLALTLVLGRA